MHLRILASLLGLAIGFSAHATDTADGSTSKNPLLSERWKNFKSPISTDAKYIVLSGAGLTLILLVNDDQWVDQPSQEITENKIMSTFWSDTADNYGKLIPNALYVAGMVGYGYYAQDSIATKRGLMMLEASVYSGVTTLVLKESVRQPRPPPSKSRDSFPSGHTTSAFTFASLVQAEHGWYWGSLAYSGALLTAYQRQHNSKHYIHDVVAGATIGAAFGYGISWVNKKSPLLTVMAVPEFDGGRATVTMGF